MADSIDDNIGNNKDFQNSLNSTNPQISGFTGNVPCPTCGHCPTCGRGNYQQQYPYRVLMDGGTWIS